MYGESGVTEMYYYPMLRNMREDHDLEQAAIAKLLKTTQQQYSKYELGVQEIPVHHLITLADFYGVSTDYLLGRTKHSDSFPQR